MVAGPTKSVVGARTIALLTVLVDELQTHLAVFAEAGAEGPVFVGDRVGPAASGYLPPQSKMGRDGRPRGASVRLPLP